MYSFTLTSHSFTGDMLSLISMTAKFSLHLEDSWHSEYVWAMFDLSTLLVFWINLCHPVAENVHLDVGCCVHSFFYTLLCINQMRMLFPVGHTNVHLDVGCVVCMPHLYFIMCKPDEDAIPCGAYLSHKIFHTSNASLSFNYIVLAW